MGVPKSSEAQTWTTFGLPVPEVPGQDVRGQVGARYVPEVEVRVGVGESGGNDSVLEFALHLASPFAPFFAINLPL